MSPLELERRQTGLGVLWSSVGFSHFPDRAKALLEILSAIRHGAKNTFEGVKNGAVRTATIC